MRKSYAGYTYAELYTQFFNEFLTIERFAEYYLIHPSKARRILTIGRASRQDRFGHH